MPIRYARPYAPKYYNPNWGTNSIKKQTWDHNQKMKAKTTNNTNNTNTKSKDNKKK